VRYGVYLLKGLDEQAALVAMVLFVSLNEEGRSMFLYD
jgi:hypothetical protein